MIVSPATDRPMIFPFALVDGQIVHACDPDAHQTVLVELPIFIAAAAEPVAAAVSIVNGGSGGRFIFSACMSVPKRTAIRSPPGSASSCLCNDVIMRASRVSLHGRKRGWCQQLAANVLDELAILLRLGDHCDPFGIGEKSTPALLALGHAVPGEHVGDLLAALADQRGPKPGLADAVLLPDPQRFVLV
jgi:hypothetical protein